MKDSIENEISLERKYLKGQLTTRGRKEHRRLNLALKI